MEGLPPLTLLDPVIDVLEFFAKLHPSRLNARQNSRDRAIFLTHHISQILFCFQSWCNQLQWWSSCQVGFQDPSKSYSSSTRATMTKNLVESWLPLAKLRGSVKAQWHTLPISFGGSGSKYLKFVRSAHRQFQCWSQRLARAQLRTGQRLF